MNPNINNNGNTPVSHTGLPATTTNASVGRNNPQQRVHYPQGVTPGSIRAHGSLMQQNSGRYGIAIGSQLLLFYGDWQQTLAQVGYRYRPPVSTPAVVYYNSRDRVPQARVVLAGYELAPLRLDIHAYESQRQAHSPSFENLLRQYGHEVVRSPSPDHGQAGSPGAPVSSSTSGQSSGHTTVTPQSRHWSTQDRQGTQATSTTVSVLQRRHRSASPLQSSQSSQSSHSSQRLTQRRRLHSPAAGSSAVASTSAAASGSAAPPNPGFMTVQQYRNSMPIDARDRNRSRVCGLIAIGTFVGVPLPLEHAQPHLTTRPENGLTSDESARILLNQFGVPTTSRDFYGFYDAATVRHALQRMVQRGGFDRVLVHHHWPHLSHEGVREVRAHQLTVMQVNGQWWCYDANPRNTSHLPYVVPDLAEFLARRFEEVPEAWVGQRGLELLTSNGLPPAFTNNLQRYQADAQSMQPFQPSHDSLSAESAAIISPMVAQRTRLLTQLAQEVEPVSAPLANRIRQLDPASAGNRHIALVVLAFENLEPIEQNSVRRLEGAESSVWIRVLLDRRGLVLRGSTVEAIAHEWNQQVEPFEAWHEAVTYWAIMLPQPVPTPEPIQNGAAFFRAERLGLVRGTSSMDMVIDRHRLGDAAVLMNLLGEPVSFDLPAPERGQSRIQRLAATLSDVYLRVPRMISFTDMESMRDHANGVMEDRGIAVIYGTRNSGRIESTIQFRREIDNIWRVHRRETSTRQGAWVHIAGSVGDYLFRRVNLLQSASRVEMLWLRDGIPREGIRTPQGTTLVENLIQRMIVAMGYFSGNSTDSSSDSSSDVSDVIESYSGTANNDNGPNVPASEAESLDIFEIDDVSDSAGTPAFIGSPASVADAFSDNDDDVRYIAENDNGMDLGTQSDDVNDNVGTSDSSASPVSVSDAINNNDNGSLFDSVSGRTSDIGSQSGSDNVSLSSSVDSTDSVSNAGSAGSTSAPAYLPNFAIEGNGRRWMALHDRFMSMDVPPTAQRYRILEAADEFLQFLEINPLPVAPDSEQTTSDIEVLVNNEEAFRQAWDMHAEYLDVLRADGDDAGDDPIRNQAMLGLWNPAIANVSDMPARHGLLARAYDSELRQRAPSLEMLDRALSTASTLIALIPEGDPVTYLRNLTPDERQALVDQGLSGIRNLTGERNYRRFANAFIDFVVDQTLPFSQIDSPPDRPHIMLFANSRGLMAAFERQQTTRTNSTRRINSQTRSRIMREALAFGTWMQNAQVQPGETMRLMADRYMEVTFPGDADRRPSQRHRNYPTVRSTVIDRLLPFLNTHYGDPNACTTALSQPVVQRPVVQRTSLPVTDVMRLFLDDHNFMAALNDQVIHHSGLAAFSSSGMLIEIRNFGAWLRVARAQPGETLAQMAERYLDATFPLDAAAAPARRPARYGPARRAIVTHLLPFMNSFLDATNASTAPPQPANNSGDEMEQE